MILIDTSLWVDHLAHADENVQARLNTGEVVMHPYVIGEIALGTLRHRRDVLRRLKMLEEAPVATAEEVLKLIDAAELGGRGIGYVDAHLLASTRMIYDGRLWTRDRRLAAVAERLGVAHQPLH